MMRRVIRVVSVLSVLMLAAASQARAQGFGVGYTDIGPVIGLGSIGDAGVSIGGRFEYGIKDLPDLGNGVLSFSASVDHYSYNLYGYGWSYTPIGAAISYHFHLDNRKIDPFIGLGLGDYIVTLPACGNVPGCSGNSGVYFIGRLGLRYFMAPSVALYGDVGAGAGALHVGLMFKLKDGK